MIHTLKSIRDVPKRTLKSIRDVLKQQKFTKKEISTAMAIIGVVIGGFGMYRHLTPNDNTTIRRKTYENWEKDIRELTHNIIQRYKHVSSSIIPTNNHPIRAIRKKTIVVADMVTRNNRSMSDLFQSKEKHLPRKQKIQLYHIGNKTSDGVSFGYDEKKKNLNTLQQMLVVSQI